MGRFTDMGSEELPVRKLYMHTIEGLPAYFWKYQIVCAGKSIKTSDMCRSLYMIKKQQRLSRQYREKNGFRSPRYGYVIVKSSEFI